MFWQSDKIGDKARAKWMVFFSFETKLSLVLHFSFWWPVIIPVNIMTWTSLKLIWALCVHFYNSVFRSLSFKIWLTFIQIYNVWKNLHMIHFELKDLHTLTVKNMILLFPIMFCQILQIIYELRKLWLNVIPEKLQTANSDHH